MKKDTIYKGVTIKIQEGIPRRTRGKFTLIWPGHEETTDSQFFQYNFILHEAKEFIDEWINQGYIVIP